MGNHLKVTYRLRERGTQSPHPRLAGERGVTTQSATKMVRRLTERGLLRPSVDGGVELTDEGAVNAPRIVRCHRLLELYLIARLGYSPEGVHTEAERIVRRGLGCTRIILSSCLENGPL
jgi:DtxR family Mn-dependent transcriptional regulator